jgi:hypothetical protein
MKDVKSHRLKIKRQSHELQNQETHGDCLLMCTLPASDAAENIEKKYCVNETHASNYRSVFHGSRPRERSKAYLCLINN